MTADPHVATMQIAADPEQVFRYFTEPEALTRWMGRHAVLDPMPGGECSLDIYRINVRGQDLEVDRPRRLVISWVMKGQRCSRRLRAAPWCSSCTATCRTLKPPPMPSAGPFP